MFKLIRELESNGVVSLDHLLSVEIIYEAVNDEQMNLLANMVNWIGPIRNLARRIRNLCAPKPLSVREIKFFKKTLRRQITREKRVNYEELLDNFPGRSLQYLTSTAQKLIKKMR